MSDIYEFTASVTEITENTEGWGDTKRVVGVRLKARYVLDVVGDDDVIERNVELTLPKELGRLFYPGDKITVGLAN